MFRKSHVQAIMERLPTQAKPGSHTRHTASMTQVRGQKHRTLEDMPATKAFSSEARCAVLHPSQWEGPQESQWCSDFGAR